MKSIETSAAPAAIGTYSQARQASNTIYFAGQIPLSPETMQLIGEDIQSQVKQVFLNLKAVAQAAGGSLDDIVKLTVYLMNIADVSVVNEVMEDFFKKPYPARTSFAVVALPKNAKIEIDAIMVLA